MSKQKRFIDASKERMNRLEERLGGILKPIDPRKEFVNDVRQRILVIRKPNIVSRFTIYQIGLAILIGIIIMALLIAMAIRALLSLLAPLKLKKGDKHQQKSLQVSS